jgi:hypothetical protein
VPRPEPTRSRSLPGNSTYPVTQRRNFQGIFHRGDASQIVITGFNALSGLMTVQTRYVVLSGLCSHQFSEDAGVERQKPRRPINDDRRSRRRFCRRIGHRNSATRVWPSLVGRSRAGSGGAEPIRHHCDGMIGIDRGKNVNTIHPTRLLLASCWIARGKPLFGREAGTPASWPFHCRARTGESAGEPAEKLTFPPSTRDKGGYRG